MIEPYSCREASYTKRLLFQRKSFWFTENSRSRTPTDKQATRRLDHKRRQH